MTATFDLPTPLDLSISIEGQAFRWRLSGGWWTGVLGKNAVRLRVLDEGNAPRLEIESAPSSPDAVVLELRHYLGLDVDIEATRTLLAQKEPQLTEALNITQGLRLLRQDPWECLASFILSQNSNIPRIQRNIEDLALLAGERFEAWGSAVRTFPTPVSLSRLSEDALRELALGYRAPSLLTAARRVVEGALDLEGLRHRPYSEARAALMALPGVGPKVADCILAYGLDHGEAFPVDTWVEKAVLRLWPRDALRTRESLATWARERFGPHAAYVQQMLFIAERHRTMALRPSPGHESPRTLPSTK